MATATELYDEGYAPIYRRLYVEHPQWRDKHARNLEILGELLGPERSWLDALCGQAWHFRHVEAASKTGIDASAAQLAVARHENPAATFIEADILAVELGDARFDVVTSFWGSYSYLDDFEAIAALLDRLAGWTAPGGALYLEIITPETLAAFNRIAFAAESGARTELRTADGVRWSYRDPGGLHRLTSPRLEWFLEALAPRFASVEVRGAVSTMQQLVATAAG